MHNNIIAVIPTYNRGNMLKQCIDSLLNQSYPLEKIVIIDADSTDNTNDIINSYGSIVDTIHGDGNWWWATCMNAGIEYGLSKGADYILAMNDDTFLETNAIEYLLESSQKYKGAIIGGIVMDKEKSGQMINKGYGAKYTKYRWYPYKKVVGAVNGRDIYYTEGQSGRGVLFPASVYKKVGLYDIENFPHRGDRDFSYRCLQMGIGQYLDSGATVYLNFDSSYQGVANKRFTFKDVKSALFHINGLYNIDHQYKFLRKHYKYLWPLWLIGWLLPVVGKCIIRMTPFRGNIFNRFFKRRAYGPNS